MKNLKGQCRSEELRCPQALDATRPAERAGRVDHGSWPLHMISSQNSMVTIPSVLKQLCCELKRFLQSRLRTFPPVRMLDLFFFLSGYLTWTLEPNSIPSGKSNGHTTSKQGRHLGFTTTWVPHIQHMFHLTRQFSPVSAPHHYTKKIKLAALEERGLGKNFNLANFVLQVVL